MNKEQTLGMSFTPDQCGSAIECVTKKEALEAMDIYAKQQSIEFAKYLSNEYKEIHKGQFVSLSNFHNVENLQMVKNWTIEELYNLFLEQR